MNFFVHVSAQFQIFAGIHPVPDSRHNIVNEQEDQYNARPSSHQFEFRILLDASSSSGSFVFGGGGFISFAEDSSARRTQRITGKVMDHECG